MSEITVWECNGCTQLYREEYEANNCCDPEEVTAYECGNRNDPDACDEDGFHLVREYADKCRSDKAEKILKEYQKTDICVCGGLKRHHRVDASHNGCYDPGCFCRAFQGILAPVSVK